MNWIPLLLAWALMKGGGGSGAPKWPSPKHPPPSRPAAPKPKAAAPKAASHSPIPKGVAKKIPKLHIP